MVLTSRIQHNTNLEPNENGNSQGSMVGITSSPHAHSEEVWRKVIRNILGSGYSNEWNQLLLVLVAGLQDKNLFLFFGTASRRQFILCGMKEIGDEWESFQKLHQFLRHCLINWLGIKSPRLKEDGARDMKLT
ncbi:hypothetical protein Bca4012_060835 [Brassica carinata]